MLDQWLEQGKDVEQSELRSFIKILRKFNRPKHALEISEWMENQASHSLSHGDAAVKLDLISKVYGIEQAEEYFNAIPSDLKHYKVYGSLLNCYAKKKSLEKAEAIMQKMRELDFTKSPLPYNVMLNLYSQLGEQEKLRLLMQEMEEKDISCDRFTLNIMLNAHIGASNVEGMENLLTKMEADPNVVVGWNAYGTVANGYMKAGLTEKALIMLKRLEQIISGKKGKLAYEILLTSYAAAGKREEVYRIWNLYKNMKKTYNSGYLCMISSLLKLDDIPGAEKILEEWESRHKFSDARIRNTMIRGYCKKGLLEKAEEYVNKLAENGKVLNADTWECLATGYKLENKMDKAVETMKKALLASQPERRSSPFTLAACLDYLKSREDLEEATAFLRLTRERGILSVDVYERLLNYINDGNLSSKAVDVIMEGSEWSFHGKTGA